MKLYGSLTSPYVRKVRTFLHEKGVAYDFIVESPSDAAGNVARLNPLGKIPVLVRNDGEALFDSPMVIEYIDSLRGAPLIPPSGETRWQAQRWHALGQDTQLIARQESKVAAALRFAAQHYSGGDYLVGASFSIADVALGVALEYIDLRYAHDWRSQYPQLAAWLRPIAQRAAFIDTAPPKS